MSTTIAVEDLRLGMHIHLDGGWLSHPFPLSSFRVSSPEQIATLKSLGLARVRWDPVQSDAGEPPADAAAAPAAPESAAADPAVQARRAALARQTAATRQCERQHAEASRVWREASSTVTARPREAGRLTLQLAQAIVDKMADCRDVGLRVVAAVGDRAASHALNTAVVSLLVGRQLGLEGAELVALGAGALMHDIGKLDVPDRWRHVEPGFNAVQIAAYRDHVARGVATGQRIGLPAAAVTVIAQHHENVDGSGFPLRLVGERIAVAARVVAIVNRYDNLCNPQTRALALTPHEAISTLYAQGRHRLDAALLHAFIRLMGVYPVGSLVQLSDDRYAMVVGCNATRPLKPRVLVHDAGVPRSDALVVDLEEHPDLGILRSLTPGKLPAAALDYLDPRPRVSYYFEPLDAAPDEETPP